MSKPQSFIRAKRILCGPGEHPPYMEVDVVPFTLNQEKAVKAKRPARQKGRCKVSPPKQKNLNDKNSKRYYVQLGEANFFKGDLVAHLSYEDAYLPATYDDAVAIATNFLRRLNYRRLKVGLPPIKYMLGTAEGQKKGGTHRWHHHIMMNGTTDADGRELITRDEIEAMWWAEKEKRKDGKVIRPAVMYGDANVDRLRPKKNGIQNLLNYIARQTKGKKHWTQSQNLFLPVYRKNDGKFTRKKLDLAIRLPQDCDTYRQYWETQYPGYRLEDSHREYNEQTGWSFYLKFRRMDC